MNDPDREDLQSISEDMAADAAELARIEGQKEGADPDCPETMELALHAERLANELAEKARVERKLVEGLSPTRRR